MNIITVHNYLSLITMSNLFNYICSYDEDKKLDIGKLLSYTKLLYYRCQNLNTRIKTYKLCNKYYGIYYFVNETGECHLILNMHDGCFDGDIKYYLECNQLFIIEKFKMNRIEKTIQNGGYYISTCNYRRGRLHGISVSNMLDSISHNLYYNGQQHGSQYHKSYHRIYIDTYKYDKPHKYQIRIEKNKCEISFYKNNQMKFKKTLNSDITKTIMSHQTIKAPYRHF